MAKLNTKIVMLEGEQGKDGTNIKSVEKSASDGLTDTYTITLTDGSKSSFNVTNGKGITSISKTGEIGLDDIYTITYNDETTSTFTVPNGKATDLVQSQIVPTASIESGETASKAYSVGEYLAKDFILYKVTKAIAEGDALTVGDNIASETIAEGIYSINGRLTQVQSQIVPTASIEVGETASKAYSVGDFIAKDGILYKVTTDIAKGDALTVGTNIAMTTVGCELSSINERLLRYKTIMFTYYYAEKGKVVKLKLKDIVKDLGTYAFVDGSTYIETIDDLGYYINLPIGCTINSNSGYASCYIEFTPGGTIINSMNICCYSSRLEGTFYVILHYLPIE